MDAYLPVHQESNSQENGDVPNRDCRTPRPSESHHTPLPGESLTVGTCSDSLARLERSGARKRS
jgi:hypothetical protein